MFLRSIENFFNSFFTEISIRQKFFSCFKKEFLKKELKFLIYESEIVSIGIFLFISSSFFYKKEKEKYFDFNWKSYLKIFSNSSIKEFIECAIIYLLDMNFIVRNRQEILNFFKNNKKVDFEEKYIFSLIKKNSKECNLDLNINFSKYFNLIGKAVVIHNFYKYKIPKDHSKVSDLIKFTFDWKKEVFEIFGNRSEYILFVFFVNLCK